MNIRFISRPISPPWDSGSRNMAYGLGVYLGKYQHKIHIPTVRGFHPSATNIIAEPVFTNRSFDWFQKARLFLHLLTARSVDIFHFFLGLTDSTAKMLSWAARIRRTPSVITLTHIPKLGKPPVAFGQRIVTYSAYLAQLLQQAGIEKVIHIPPGIDEQQFHPGINDHHKVGSALGIPSDVPVILYGGQFSKSATLGTLLKTISLCVARNKETHFVLACRIRRKHERVRQKEIIQQLKNVTWGRNVIVHERVHNMRGLIARADVCVLPLRNTYGKVDIPLFLLEAMALAKPIVITDVAPMNELLEDPVGLAVPVDDEDALTHAIEKMLVEGKNYGACGRKLIEKKYTLKQVAGQYQSLYLGLLDEAHSKLL
ncbi:glycosyltransferase family 4 protein [Thermodesulfobacteriota bacterium]